METSNPRSETPPTSFCERSFEPNCASETLSRYFSPGSSPPSSSRSSSRFRGSPPSHCSSSSSRWRTPFTRGKLCPTAGCPNECQVVLPGGTLSHDTRKTRRFRRIRRSSSRRFSNWRRVKGIFNDMIENNFGGTTANKSAETKRFRRTVRPPPHGPPARRRSPPSPRPDPPPTR